MIEKETVLIIGAGASAEAGLPTGQGLKSKIASLLNFVFEVGRGLSTGDTHLYQAIRNAVKRINPNLSEIDSYIEAAWRIRDAMPQVMSIDNFIDMHQGDKKIELCGKLAITRAILQAEHNSILYGEPPNPHATQNSLNLEKTWYTAFWQVLTENATKDQLEKRFSTVSLIVFNYDRCIEHFLYHSLQTTYGLQKDVAAKLVQKMKIYHPYGSVGYLPWYRKENSIDFGSDPNAVLLVSLAEQIRTFTEGTDPNSSDVAAIRQMMASARIVVFLGFAFHNLNMKLLSISQSTGDLKKSTRYFGTAYGISQSDCGNIVGTIVKKLGADGGLVKLHRDLMCYQLFHEYSRTFSMSG